MTNWYREILTKITESVAEIEDGFMRHTHDIAGLQDYLRQMGIIPKDGVLLTMSNFENCLENPGHNPGHPIFGYYINSDERGDFYADVRDERGNTVYEVKNEVDDDGDEFEDEYGDEEIEEGWNIQPALHQYAADYYKNHPEYGKNDMVTAVHDHHVENSNNEHMYSPTTTMHPGIHAKAAAHHAKKSRELSGEDRLAHDSLAQYHSDKSK